VKIKNINYEASAEAEIRYRQQNNEENVIIV